MYTCFVAPHCAVVAASTLRRYGGPLGRVAAEARVGVLDIGGFVVRQQLMQPTAVGPRTGFVLTVKGPDKCR